MKAPRRSCKIDERGLIEDLASPKEVCCGKVPTAALELDLSPLVGGLKDHFPIRICFELYDNKAAVTA